MLMCTLQKNYFRNFNFNFNYRKLNSKLQNPLFLAQHDIGFEIKDQGTGAVLLWSYCSGALVFNFKSYIVLGQKKWIYSPGQSGTVRDINFRS